MRMLLGSKIWLTLVVVALALSSSVIFAHEGRETGGYHLVVGFMNEPAYEGFQNAVSIRVTKHADEEMAHEGMGHGDGEMAMIDVEAHGALFVSEALAHDGTFSLEIPHEWEDLTIPYHSHLDHDMSGSITVSHDASMSGTVEVMIENGAFNPGDITVMPGSTVVWTNHTEDPHIVTSGVMTAGHSHEEEMVPVEGLGSTLQVEVTHVPTGVSKTLTLRAVFNDPGHYAADLIPTAPGAYRFRFVGTIEGTKIDEAFESGPNTFSEIEPTDTLQFPETVPAVRELEGAVRGAQTTAQEAQDTATSASTLGIIGIVLGAAGIASGIGGVAMGMRKR